MMPIMMTMLFMGFPAGLNLYYFVFNIFSILEQKLYFKLVGDIKLEPVKVKKKSWMQKMMEETEKRQKMTQQMRNQRKK
jgi:YidC/Oxa1 family membrane protein insertase